MKYLLAYIPVLKDNQYKLEKTFVGVDSRGAICMDSTPQALLAAGKTPKTFVTDIEATLWARKCLSRASNIANVAVFDSNTHSGNKVLENFTLEDILEDVVTQEAQGFLANASFPGYLHNRLSQLKTSNVNRMLFAADDIRVNHDSRMLFFADLYEDSSEQLFIAENLKQMQKKLDELFNTHVYWVKLQHPEIPASKAIYWGHVDNATHIILYKI